MAQSSSPQRVMPAFWAGLLWREDCVFGQSALYLMRARVWQTEHRRAMSNRAKNSLWGLVGQEL